MLHYIRKTRRENCSWTFWIWFCFPLPSTPSSEQPLCRRSYSNWPLYSSLNTLISCSIRLLVRTRMEIHPFTVAFSFWRKTQASVETDGKTSLKWIRLSPHHHRMLRMAWFAPMAPLTPRIPTEQQDHPLALMPGLSTSHRCWHMAEAPAVKTCHTGRAASILLSLTDISSFAPDSHGAADGGIHRF